MQHLERALDKQNQWWKYALVVLAGFIGAQFIGSIPLIGVIFYKSMQSNDFEVLLSENGMDLAAFGIGPNLGLALLLIPFVLSLLVTMLLIKPMHQRHWKEVTNGTKTIRWNRFFFAALVWGLLLAVALFVDHQLNPENFRIQFDLIAFLPLLLIALLLIPLQTTFEELLFRGYLAQAFGAWTRSRWMVLLVPSLAFALMHIANPEVEAHGFWLTMPQYFLFGLTFGLVAILDDGIECAMGAHAINNIFTAIFVTNESSVFQTPAVFEQLTVDPAREAWMLLVFCIVFLGILTWRYKWNFKVLNTRIEAAVNPMDDVINHLVSHEADNQV